MFSRLIYYDIVVSYLYEIFVISGVLIPLVLARGRSVTFCTVTCRNLRLYGGRSSKEVTTPIFERRGESILVKSVNRTFNFDVLF